MSNPVYILNGRTYKTVAGLSRALFADCGCDSHSMVHPVTRRITCTKGRDPRVTVAQYIVSAPKLGEAMTVVRAGVARFEDGAVMSACPNHVVDEDGAFVCECGDEGRTCVVCAAEEAGYWATMFRAAPLSERDPAAYEQELRDAGRGHLVRS